MGFLVGGRGTGFVGLLHVLDSVAWINVCALVAGGMPVVRLAVRGGLGLLVCPVRLFSEPRRFSGVLRGFRPFFCDPSEFGLDATHALKPTHVEVIAFTNLIRHDLLNASGLGST